MTIVMCCTENWIHYLMVSLYSLFKHNEVDKMYVLTNTDEVKELEFYKKKYDTEFVVLNYDKIIPKFLNELSPNNNNQTYTNAALIRLLIPKIVSEEKVLYLDTDIIVDGDLMDLWETNITNYLLAGIQDNNIISYIEYLDLNNIPDNYINSGVLLMNVKKMLKDRFTEKTFDLLNKNKYYFPDQDVINIVCHGKTLFLNNKYNSSRVTGYNINPTIIHYVSLKGNWIKGLPLNEKWYDTEKAYLKDYQKFLKKNKS